MSDSDTFCRKERQELADIGGARTKRTRLPETRRPIEKVNPWKTALGFAPQLLSDKAGLLQHRVRSAGANRGPAGDRSSSGSTHVEMNDSIF